jgi:hypothetical protein
LKDSAQEKAYCVKEDAKHKAHVLNKKANSVAQNVKDNLQEKTRSISHNANKVAQNAKRKMNSVEEELYYDNTLLTRKGIEDRARNLDEDLEVITVNTREGLENRVTAYSAQENLENKVYALQKDLAANSREMKKNFKEILKITKKRQHNLAAKLADARKKYDELLNKLVAERVSKTECERNRELRALKRDIESIEYEMDMLQQRYNKLWAKVHPNLARFAYKLRTRFHF